VSIMSIAFTIRRSRALRAAVHTTTPCLSQLEIDKASPAEPAHHNGALPAKLMVHLSSVAWVGRRFHAVPPSWWRRRCRRLPVRRDRPPHRRGTLGARNVETSHRCDVLPTPSWAAGVTDSARMRCIRAEGISGRSRGCLKGVDSHRYSEASARCFGPARHGAYDWRAVGDCGRGSAVAVGLIFLSGRGARTFWRQWRRSAIWQR
jgi:hypothetical protein